MQTWRWLGGWNEGKEVEVRREMERERCKKKRWAKREATDERGRWSESEL